MIILHSSMKEVKLACLTKTKIKHKGQNKPESQNYKDFEKKCTCRRPNNLTAKLKKNNDDKNQHKTSQILYNHMPYNKWKKLFLQFIFFG